MVESFELTNLGSANAQKSGGKPAFLTLSCLQLSFQSNLESPSICISSHTVEGLSGREGGLAPALLCCGKAATNDAD